MEAVKPLFSNEIAGVIVTVLTKFLRTQIFSLILLSASTASFGQAGRCGDPTPGVAKDYRTATTGEIIMVERRHFTDDVRMMRRGSTDLLGADLAYTLNRFPNHHGALRVMGDYSLKTKENPPRGARLVVECWFDRALRFAPDDAMVKTIYGLYLLKAGKPKDATTQLEAAASQAGGDANVHYNLGLAYFDLRQYDKALSNAHEAYRLGFPLPGLKNKLQRAGTWREP